MTESRPRILIVDDLPANLLTLGAALTADFELQIATSGSQGLALASTQPPDLILLDVMMPEMDGYETCRRLQANPQLKRIPVIFITAMTEDEAEATGLALGAADYLTKPINVPIARQRIRNLLERERLRQEVEAHRDHLDELVRERTLSLAIAKEAAETSLRAKSAFLSAISHELRTPMHVIQGMTDLALRRSTDPRQASHLTKARGASQQLMSLIDQLLSITHLEASRLTLDAAPFRPGMLLERIARLFANDAMSKGLRLDLAIDPQLASMPLLGDPLRLGQILHHLVGNAIKFTTEGAVRVDIQRGEETDTTMQLRCTVQDSGVGLAAGDQSRIFNLFEQTDDTLKQYQGGAGLGLAISKALVNLMQGEIGVNSVPDVQTQFWFTVCLPKNTSRMEADRNEIPGAEAESLLREQQSGTLILAVTAGLISQEVLRMLLEDVGLRVDLTADLETAWPLARQTGYALTLIDMELAESHGDVGIRSLRDARPDMPIIALLDGSLGGEQLRCAAMDINDWVAKPIDPEQLFSHLWKWLAPARGE